MSWTIVVFVNLAPSLEALAREVGDLLNVGLRRVENDNGIKYEYHDPDFTLDLYANHELENDRDMNFQDYSLQLSLWRLNTQNPEQSRVKALSFARRAYDGLKLLGRYQLMLVENTQKKLDSFDPMMPGESAILTLP